MFDEADAFVALPGGFGTLEELFEMVRKRDSENDFIYLFIYFLFIVSRPASSPTSKKKKKKLLPRFLLLLLLPVLLSDHLAAARIPHQARRRPQLRGLLRQAPQLLRRHGLLRLRRAGVEGDRRRRPERGRPAGRAGGAQAAAARGSPERDAFHVRGGVELRLCGFHFKFTAFFLSFLWKKQGRYLSFLFFSCCSFLPLFISGHSSAKKGEARVIIRRRCRPSQA